MATRNGPYQNYARIEWYWTVGTARAGDTSVSVTCRAYLRMDGSHASNGTWYKSRSGNWGSSSGNGTHNLGFGERTQLWSRTYNVSLQSSARNVTNSALSDHFWGRSSDSVSIRIPARVPAPPRPTLTLSNPSFTGFRASWTQSGSSITSSQVRWAKNSNMSGASTLTRSSPHTFSGFIPGDTYYVQARNYNASGWSSWSATKSMTTTARPGAPVVTLSSPTVNSIRASWTSPGPSITSRQLRYSINSNMSGATTLTTSSPRTITGLSQGTLYYVQARSQNGGGWGPWSATKSLRTLPGRSVLTLDTPATQGFRASWTEPTTGANGRQFQYATNSSFSGAVTLTGGSPQTVTGRTPGTTYYGRSRVRNASGWGAWSVTRSITTLPAVPPTLSLSGNAAGTTITAAMTMPVGSVTSYNLEWEYLGPGSTPSGQNGSQSGGNAQTITGRRPGASYRVRAWVTIGSYQSPKSDWEIIVMNAPTVLSGDYFDGTDAQTSDVSFRWAGTAHASASEAVARFKPTGWDSLSSGADVVHRVTDSLVSHGTYLARATRKITTGSPFLVTVGDSGTPVEVSGNIPYFARIHIRPSLDVEVEFLIRWVGSSAPDSTAELVQVAANETQILTVEGQSPSDATHALLVVSAVSGQDMYPGDFIDLDGAIMSVGTPTPYFDGGYPSTARNRYSWEGASNNSISMHEILDAEEADPFTDPECEGPPSPPRAPIIDNPCIDEVGIWRRYWAHIPASEISNHLDVLPTFTINVGSVDAGQIRVRVFPNPDDLPVEEFTASGDWESEQILSFVPANSRIVLDSLSERAYGRVGEDGGWRDVNHLLYGTGGRPASWPVLSCGSSYLVAFDMPMEAPLGNITLSTALTMRMG